MQRVERNTDTRPQATQGRAVLRGFQVQSQNADHGQVEAVQNTGPGRPVVQLLGKREIPRVEKHAERPAGQSDISESHVVFPEGVPGGDRLLDSGHAMPMSQEVEKGKEHRKGLLHP